MRAGAALMTHSGPSGERAVPGTGRIEHHAVHESTGALLLLTRATRRLADAPDDASDAALLGLLATVVVPDLGDVIAVYRTTPTGEVALEAAAPARAELAIRLAAYLEAQPALAADYAPTVSQGSPVLARPGSHELAQKLGI